MCSVYGTVSAGFSCRMDSTKLQSYSVSSFGIICKVLATLKSHDERIEMETGHRQPRTVTLLIQG